MMIDIDELLFSDKNRPVLRTCVAYGLVTLSLHTVAAPAVGASGSQNRAAV